MYTHTILVTQTKLICTISPKQILVNPNPYCWVDKKIFALRRINY